MRSSFRGLGLDACDVQALTEFWRDAAGYEIDQKGYPYWSVLISEDSSTPRIIIVQVPEGKSNKNRLHMEFDVEDLEMESDRLVTLGATRVTKREFGDTHWIVMEDPEGNEFCLLKEHQHG